MNLHIHITRLILQVDDLLKEFLVPTVKLDGFDILKHFMLKLAEFLIDLMSFVMLVAEAVMNSLIHLKKDQEKSDSHDESTAKNHVEPIEAVNELEWRGDQTWAFPGKTSESPGSSVDAVDGSIRKVFRRCLRQLELFLQNHGLNNLLWWSADFEAFVATVLMEQRKADNAQK